MTVFFRQHVLNSSSTRLIFFNPPVLATFEFYVNIGAYFLFFFYSSNIFALSLEPTSFRNSDLEVMVSVDGIYMSQH